MSHQPQTHGNQEVDPLESIIHSVPIVIPLLGGLLIFLLAFIAVFMA
jgi:hypothetical protein